MDNIFDIVVVGGGPTGINVGIEASKAGLRCLILEKGFLVNSLFNFPKNMLFFSTSLKLEIGEIPFISHTDKPTRDEALEYYRRITESYKLDVRFHEKVNDVSKVKHLFKVVTSKGTYHSKNIVIATGFYDYPRLLNVPGEELPKVKHYYDEAHRYIGKKIVVIGGANSGCDVALETWSKGAEVTMVIRDSKLYEKVKYWILPNIENRIKEGSIKAYFNSEVTSITEERVMIKTPEGEISLMNDAVLAMIGYKPDYNFLTHLGVTFNNDEAKTPILDDLTFMSETPGMYLAGVVNGGLATNKLFIENTRHHAKAIVSNIVLTS